MEALLKASLQIRAESFIGLSKWMDQTRAEVLDS